MERVTTIAAIRARSRAARARGHTVGLVPTMGALHEGHLSLVRAARAAADLVVVSVFVNPTQFGPGEDLDAYPRDLEGDEARLRALGDDAPDLVFAPPVEEVYPGEPLTTVHVDRLTDVLCGASRPGHFDGVTTVVNKLFNIVEPDRAFFGRKDFQQLAVIRRMVADLDQPVDVVGAPTVREADGLAMSSRNAYLDEEQRRDALALSRGLRAAVATARRARDDGHGPTAMQLREAVLVTLGEHPDIRVDYVDVLDPQSLTPPAPDAGSVDPAERREQQLLVAIAAHVGPARLIDNVVVGDREDEDRLLAATDR